MSRYDVIVVGAGHNGLTAAAYLAKSGKKVLVLERRPLVGGAAVTEDFASGFKVSSGAALCDRFSSDIVRDLGLFNHGLEFLAGAGLFVPTLQGPPLMLWNDLEKAAQAIRPLSEKDAESYLAFCAFLRRLRPFFEVFSRTVPPEEPMPNGLGDAVKLGALGWALRKLGKRDMYRMLRFASMCADDFLREWFDTEILRAALAGTAVLGTTQGPLSAGTAMHFLYHAMGGRTPALRGGIPSGAAVRGGMGALSAALAKSAERFGAKIRTEAEVASILVKEGAVTGVCLKGGEKITTSAVLSNADPKRTLLKLIDTTCLPADFVLALRGIAMKGCVAKLHFALSELPRFSCLSGEGDSGHLKGMIQIGATVNYIERAYDDAKYGRVSQKPLLRLTIPSLCDPALAPDGRHVMSVLMQYAPYTLKDGGWNDARREALGDLVADTLSAYAPNFKASVLHRQVLTPLDLEERFALTGGHITHGEMTLDQMFFQRPLPGWARYRTPLKNLYLCGAGTHPGGGVTGIPGRNAAREALRDLS